MNIVTALRTLARGKPEPPDVSWHWEVEQIGQSPEGHWVRLVRVYGDGTKRYPAAVTGETPEAAFDAAHQWIMEQPRG